MLPFDEIWENIMKIHSAYETPFSMGKKYQEFDRKTVQMILEAKNDFYLETSEYVENIEEIMSRYDDSVDFTFRYKEDFSIEEKLGRQEMTKQLYKTANDMLGMRFIIKTNPDELFEIANQFIESCPESGICNMADQREGKKNDDGYKGIHIYVRPHNQVFPIEVQFWTRTHALLNEYLHDNIYKAIDDQLLVRYALDLRDWLESVPQLSADESGVKSYVDYVYERMV